MSFLIALGALVFLMFVAYRGFPVIMFAPVAALGAVLLTDPAAAPGAFTGVFMEAMAGFLKTYFPVFLLGAIFGKLIEISGFSTSIVRSVIGLIGSRRAMLAIVLVGAILTYGGVPVFVVVFAIYPFAAELFRTSDIPERLIPGSIALGALSFSMDSLPGTPQIQNIIPTSYFKTTAYAAPLPGIVGSLLILVVGMICLERRRRKAAAAGEGCGAGHTSEPEKLVDDDRLPNPFIAILPLIVVGVLNKLFTWAIVASYGAGYDVKLAAMNAPVRVAIDKVAAVWAVEGALLVGVLTVIVFAFPRVAPRFAEGARAAVSGTLLASVNTASEYGWGSVIAALPGFIVIRDALEAIPNPLVNEAITVNALAGIAGSASGGMDTLPHNGAVITLLAGVRSHSRSILQGHLRGDLHQNDGGLRSNRLLLRNWTLLRHRKMTIWNELNW